MKQYFYQLATDQLNGIGAQLVKVLFWCVSLFYRLGLFLKQLCYKFGLSKVRKLPRKVISVGNITFGGVGKTPIVIFLAEYLKDKGFSAAVLTRGYMGRTTAKAALNSDEGVMLKKNLPGASVLIGANRFENAQTYLQNENTDIFILDDGFQHISLFRDVDIVAIDTTNPWGNKQLLPRGILREPLSSLKRADLIFLTKTDLGVANVNEIKNVLGKMRIQKPIIMTTHKAESLVEMRTQKVLPLPEVKGRKVCSFCSIGDPLSFENTLKNLGCQLIKQFTFMDHYVYTKEDIEEILNYCRSHEIDCLITTQKDAVKLDHMASMIEEGIDLLILEIKVEIVEGKEEFLNGIDSIL